MKVVINNQYGGFRMSDIAVEKCIEQGMTFSELNDKENIIDSSADFVKRPKRLELDNKYWCIHDDDIHFRTNPIVIKVIEELGDKANGYCANLKIVEVPDDVEIEIEEYDGNEWVSEKHRRWY